MKRREFKFYGVPDSDRFIFVVKEFNVITHIDFYQGYYLSEEYEIINIFLERATIKNPIVKIYNKLMMEENQYIKDFKNLKTIKRLNECIELYILTYMFYE